MAEEEGFPEKKLSSSSEFKVVVKLRETSMEE